MNQIQLFRHEHKVFQSQIVVFLLRANSELGKFVDAVC